MPVQLKSSQLQKSFGRAMDRALVEGDVVVERYGRPRVAIVEYGRYQRLAEAERAVLRARLRQASEPVSLWAAGLTEDEVKALIEESRGPIPAQVSSETEL